MSEWGHLTVFDLERSWEEARLNTLTVGGGSEQNGDESLSTSCLLVGFKALDLSAC